MFHNTLKIRTKGGERLPAALLSQLMTALSSSSQGSSLPLNIEYDNATLSNIECYRVNLGGRIKSATKAHHLLCQSSPEKKVAGIAEEINSYVDTLEKLYLTQVQSKNSFDECQQVFIDYLQHLANISSQYLKQNLKEFKVAMSMAENYVMLITPRPVLATVMKGTFKSVASNSNDYYVVQMEVPQSPFNDDVIEEFLRAKPKNLALNGAPDWYVAMSSSERQLFDYVMKEVETKEALLKLINSICSKHRSIPGVANSSEHCFGLFTSGCDLIYEAFRFRSAIIASPDLPVDNKALRRRIAVQNAKIIVQNGYQKILAKLKQQGGYFDGTGNLIGEKRQEVLDRLSLAPILFQTLISPMPIAPRTLFGYKLPPDGLLYEDKLYAVSEIIKCGVGIKIGNEVKPTVILPNPNCVFETNHPLNVARHVIGTGGSLQVGNTQKEAERLVNYAKRVMIELAESNSVELPKLKKMVDKLEFDAKDRYTRTNRFLSIPGQAQPMPPKDSEHKKLIQIIESSDRVVRELEEAIADLSALLRYNLTLSESLVDNQRELHIAMLEMFIFERLIDAIPHSTCKSNKDRETFATIGVDAMNIYSNCNNCELPKYSEKLSSSNAGSPAANPEDDFYDVSDYATKRAIWNDYYEWVLRTGQGESFAALNAHGAYGMKTADLYLPADTIAKIKSVCGERAIEILDTMASNNDFSDEKVHFQELSAESALAKLYLVDSWIHLGVRYFESILPTSTKSTKFDYSSSFLRDNDEKTLAISIVNKLIKVIQSPKWATMGVAAIGTKTPDGVQWMLNVINDSIFTASGGFKVNEESHAIALIYVFADYCKNRLKNNETDVSDMNALSSSNLYQLIMSLNDPRDEFYHTRNRESDQKTLDRFVAKYVVEPSLQPLQSPDSSLPLARGIPITVGNVKDVLYFDDYKATSAAFSGR